jgi:prevent-host-death family protein
MGVKRELGGREPEVANAEEESLAEAAERIARLLDETSVTLESWTLRSARGRFSQLVREAVELHRPQRITRRGGEAVVVVNEKDFWALVRQAPQEIPMVEYFQAVASTDDAGLEPLARAASRGIAKL